jgi:hypothetical protein
VSNLFPAILLLTADLPCRFQVLEDEGEHIAGGPLAEYAVDMAIIRDHVAPVELRAVVLLQELQRVRSALG